mmetsp:Transcript_35703/g.85157  ORF Transcript_35703/g.85157 Transcript_35703/m.85157 type:complete len:304 (-) Transcript_35703:38-949(-)
MFSISLHSTPPPSTLPLSDQLLRPGSFLISHIVNFASSLVSPSAESSKVSAFSNPKCLYIATLPSDSVSKKIGTSNLSAAAIATLSIRLPIPFPCPLFLTPIDWMYIHLFCASLMTSSLRLGTTAIDSSLLRECGGYSLSLYIGGQPQFQIPARMSRIVSLWFEDGLSVMVPRSSPFCLTPTATPVAPVRIRWFIQPSKNRTRVSFFSSGRGVAADQRKSGSWMNASARHDMPSSRSLGASTERPFPMPTSSRALLSSFFDSGLRFILHLYEAGAGEQKKRLGGLGIASGSSACLCDCSSVIV